jgi:DUF4097 and DUF4098 domain-containing protein YvlB
LFSLFERHGQSVGFGAMSETTARLRITRRSGKVHVVAEPGSSLAVDGGTFVENADGTVDVRSVQSGVLEVRCPTGSDLTISTASGAVDVEGDAGSVKVTTKSGNLSIERATAVDARGASGRVKVGVCTGRCHVVFVSSNVRIDEAAQAVVATVSGNIELGSVDDAEVKTVSGNISLGANKGGRLAARSISGAVKISLPAGSRPATRLKAVSGHVRNECEPGHDGEVRAATVSGAISVTCR